MLFHAKNGTVTAGGAEMSYISFGKGVKPLVLLPGLGDGLKTVQGTALAFALAYRAYGARCKVYVFSRKNQLEKGYSTRRMAEDQAEAMQKLGLANAYVMGVSQGGMIAQYLAAHFPALVEKLVLAVTSSRQNETLQKAVRGWMAMAQREDYQGLLRDTAEKSYSDRYLRRYRLLYPFLGAAGKPKDFSRFLIQAEACLRHDAYDELSKITCSVLIIGGGRDQIAGPDAAREMAEKISGSKLFIYETFGHAAYEEAKDFSGRVLKFLCDT